MSLFQQFRIVFTIKWKLSWVKFIILLIFSMSLIALSVYPPMRVLNGIPNLPTNKTKTSLQDQSSYQNQDESLFYHSNFSDQNHCISPKEVSNLIEYMLHDQFDQKQEVPNQIEYKVHDRYDQNEQDIDAIHFMNHENLRNQVKIFSKYRVLNDSSQPNCTIGLEGTFLHQIFELYVEQFVWMIVFTFFLLQHYLVDQITKDFESKRTISLQTMGINKNIEYISYFVLVLLFTFIISVGITAIGARNYLSVNYFQGFFIIFLYGMLCFSFPYLIVFVQRVLKTKNQFLFLMATNFLVLSELYYLQYISIESDSYIHFLLYILVPTISFKNGIHLIYLRFIQTINIQCFDQYVEQVSYQQQIFAIECLTNSFIFYTTSAIILDYNGQQWAKILQNIAVSIFSKFKQCCLNSCCKKQKRTENITSGQPLTNQEKQYGKLLHKNIQSRLDKINAYMMLKDRKYQVVQKSRSQNNSDIKFHQFNIIMIMGQNGEGKSKFCKSLTGFFENNLLNSLQVYDIAKCSIEFKKFHQVSRFIQDQNLFYQNKDISLKQIIQLYNEFCSNLIEDQNDEKDIKSTFNQADFDKKLEKYYSLLQIDKNNQKLKKSVQIQLLNFFIADPKFIIIDLKEDLTLNVKQKLFQYLLKKKDKAIIMITSNDLRDMQIFGDSMIQFKDQKIENLQSIQNFDLNPICLEIQIRANNDELENFYDKITQSNKLILISDMFIQESPEIQLMSYKIQMLSNDQDSLSQVVKLVQDYNSFLVSFQLKSYENYLKVDDENLNYNKEVFFPKTNRKAESKQNRCCNQLIGMLKLKFIQNYYTKTGILTRSVIFIILSIIIMIFSRANLNLFFLLLSLYIFLAAERIQVIVGRDHQSNFKHYMMIQSNKFYYWLSQFIVDFVLFIPLLLTFPIVYIASEYERKAIQFTILAFTLIIVEIIINVIAQIYIIVRSDSLYNRLFLLTIYIFQCIISLMIYILIFLGQDILFLYFLQIILPYTAFQAIALNERFQLHKNESIKTKDFQTTIVASLSGSIVFYFLILAFIEARKRWCCKFCYKKKCGCKKRKQSTEEIQEVQKSSKSPLSQNNSPSKLINPTLQDQEAYSPSPSIQSSFSSSLSQSYKQEKKPTQKNKEAIILKVKNLYKNISFNLERNQCIGIISCGINLDFHSLIQYLSLIKRNPMMSELTIKNDEIKIGFQTLKMNEKSNYSQFSVNKFLSCFSQIANQTKECFQRQMIDLQNYCNLKQILEKKIIDLSPGQTKRVMISLALLNYPDIIILENPFQGLDHFTKDKIIFYLNQLINSGSSIILTSTQVNGLEKLCTRFILINDKEDIQEGCFTELQQKLNFNELDVILRVSQEVIQNKKILIDCKPKLKIKANNFEAIIKSLGLTKLSELMQRIKEKQEFKQKLQISRKPFNTNKKEVDDIQYFKAFKYMKKRIELDELVFIDEFIEWALIENAILELRDELKEKQKFPIKGLRRVGRNVIFELLPSQFSIQHSQDNIALIKLMENRQQYFITDYSLGYPSLETIVLNHCLNGEKIKTNDQP